ncbi:hypothetical protein V3C99_000631 [Haemonchus contortus]
MITPTVSRREYAYVMSVVVAEYPDTADYGPFGGTITTLLTYKKNTLILILGVVLLPALIFYWRCLIIRRLDKLKNSLSEKTLLCTKVLVQALLLQGLLPCLFYIPCMMFYLISQRIRLDIKPLGYLIMILPSLPALLNSLLAIYFVAPYRMFINYVQHLTWKRSHCLPRGFQ